MLQFKMFKRSSIVASLVAAGLCAGVTGAAFAANCETVKVTLHNSTDDEIKVTKFEYKDGSNWKTENMFGLDGFQRINEHTGIYWTRDLGGIGSESTQFKTTYQHHAGGTVWGPAMTEYTSTFTCLDKHSYTVYMDR